MYKIKTEELGRLDLFPNKYYAEMLGLTPDYISSIKGGRLSVKTSIAKGIISLAYNISLNDYKMEELLEAHFIKEK